MILLHSPKTETQSPALHVADRPFDEISRKFCLTGDTI